LQLYSALVYHGFGLVQGICDGLADLLEKDGFSHISEAIGVDA
jgi:dihydroorotate dehydrogenase